MLLPAIFGENLFDDFMDDNFERNFFGSRWTIILKGTSSAAGTRCMANTAKT